MCGKDHSLHRPSRSSRAFETLVVANLQSVFNCCKYISFNHTFSWNSSTIRTVLVYLTYFCVWILWNIVIVLRCYKIQFAKQTNRILVELLIEAPNVLMLMYINVWSRSECVSSYITYLLEIRCLRCLLKVNNKLFSTGEFNLLISVSA